MIDTSNLVSKMQKKDSTRVGWPWQLMVFSSFLIGLVVAVYVGLNFGYIIFVSSQIQNLNASITKLDQEIDPATRGRFIDFYSQIAAVQKLLDSHVKTSRLFPLLELAANTKLRYTRMSLNAENGQLELSGVAADYENVSRQLQALVANPNIRTVHFRNAGAGEDGLIIFSMTLIFNPTFFL